MILARFSTHLPHRHGCSDEEEIEDEFMYFASAPMEDVEPENSGGAAVAALASAIDPRKRKASIASAGGGANQVRLSPLLAQ
jgi:hypothetical protein